jgi:hypothetical protein
MGSSVESPKDRGYRRNNRRLRVALAFVSLPFAALLSSCGEAVIGQGSTVSHAIEDCGASSATDSSGMLVNVSDYPDIVRNAEKEAALLYARTQANEGYIDLSNNRPNGYALKSTGTNLDVSYNYIGDFGGALSSGDGYAVDIGFQHYKPEISLGVLACNKGANVYETVFYRQLGTYVTESSSFPSK